MAYPKTEPKANFPQVEKEVSAFWKSDNTFHRVREKNANGETFRFFDGPATPSSIPHIGHLGISAVKDMVCRYNWMKGKNVIHKLGWDVHGLPTEVMVEKATGKQSKELVAQYGIEKFCDMCREGVMKYVDEWVKYIGRIGRWVDVADDGNTVYNTMYPTYMESVIWALKKLYDDGLLYKDFKVNPFDWMLGTVMSNSEASQEYQDIVDDAVTVWFELKDGKRVLAWTTTPWTLPANSALAVNPNMTYVVMKDTDGAEYVIAEGRVSAYEKQFANAEKIATIKGTELVGQKYTPLFPYYDDEKLYSVIYADYVSDSDGTGIVHIAPAFGEEDYLAAKALDPKFPVLVNVDDYGNFTPDVTDWAGMNIFQANPKIIETLKANGHLVKKEQYKHSYPYSPRSKGKLIYRATEAWYIDVPKIRDRLLANNAKVDWKSAGSRFEAWIEGARPWGISRNRFWGVPLPIWTNDVGEYKVFGSIAQMNEFFGADIKDLHRPTLDKLEKDGWKRIPDVLDAWFESGSMPFAAQHYPFENTGIVNAPDYMSDYIIEGVDQTRGWFYTLMVLGTALFDRPAFKTITANGHTVDEHKKKMSKSLGNYVDTNDMFATYGADAMRLNIIGSNFLKGEPVPIDKEGKVFGDTVKNILTPLWNAYHFFTLYANAGNITAKETKDWSGTPNIMDRYILVELNELFKVANDSLSSYEPYTILRRVVEFLDILNNWYIRRSRERFWNEEGDAFDTLYTVLTHLCRVLAPFAPFISDYIYRNLTGAESVHLQDYPAYTENAVSAELTDEMRRVQSVVSVGKQLRETYKLRNRLPLAKLTIAGPDMSDYADIIKDELNVKSVEFTSNVTSLADSFVYLITPKIGARLGGALKDIIPAVKRGEYEIKGDTLAAAGQTLNSDEFESRLTVKKGVTGAALPDNTAVVVLDTELNGELIAEGLANDALRFIQDTRKIIGLDVSDRITLEYSADPALNDALASHRDRIMADVLAVDMTRGTGEHQNDIEGYNFGITIKKA
ncbi:MAG: isoleucine--tRNA ligase [Rickettsiales bacterium]|jgi:isoleucyl-tRNA synthetase|nr:isoleucine--tRNA ligase [Rickettsiales bacterium]